MYLRRNSPKYHSHQNFLLWVKFQLKWSLIRSPLIQSHRKTKLVGQFPMLSIMSAVSQEAHATTAPQSTWRTLLYGLGHNNNLTGCQYRDTLSAPSGFVSLLFSQKWISAFNSSSRSVFFNFRPSLKILFLILISSEQVGSVPRQIAVMKNKISNSFYVIPRFGSVNQYVFSE